MDTNIDDLLLAQMGDAAEQATENYMCQPISATLGNDGEIPPALKQAILMLVATFYDNRESVNYQQVHMSPAYQILIGPYCRY